MFIGVCRLLRGCLYVLIGCLAVPVIGSHPIVQLKPAQVPVCVEEEEEEEGEK